ncbi:hypothetical protein, partial [Escherichia coli]|uniref:hypothetical protein n=1 Tax=Escherichia coli TaxID=562 RepID=UPI00142E2527
KVMLKAYKEARLKPSETQEEIFRAYPDPVLETKRLEIFQKMIEGTQALLEKQLDKNRSIEDHGIVTPETRQVPSGSGNLASEGKIETTDPQTSQKSLKRRKRTSKKKQTINLQGKE